jgi:two-component system response regulator FixJ
MSSNAARVEMTAAEGVRILHLVDDDPLVREVAAQILEDAGYGVTHHDDGDAFVAALPGLEPGCVLLDILMPGLDGFGVLKALADSQVSWPVVVLTARNDVRTAVDAMKRGAFEFLQKPLVPEELLGTAEDAFVRLAELAQDGAQAAEARALVDRLSKREFEVLRGLLAGLANKLIAYELDLSVRTVEIYRAKVMEKLGVRGLSSAVRLALAAGVTPLEPTK